jgi:hypothetical protein
MALSTSFASVGANVGYAKVATYVALLLKNDPLKRWWIPSFTYTPPEVIRINVNVVAIVSPPVLGVIQYRVYSLGEAVSLIAAAATYQIGLQIGAMIKTKFASPAAAFI